MHCQYNDAPDLFTADLSTGPALQVNQGLLSMSSFERIFKAYAVILFVFLPSIAMMMIMAMVAKNATYFAFFGSVTLVVNALWAISSDGRAFIGSRIR